MIYAHIKTDEGGTRDEEWEDTRITPDEKRLLQEYDAYVVAFKDDTTGQEKQVVVAKYYWDLREEIIPFMEGQPGTYPKLTAFTKEMLHAVGAYFQQYLAIEKSLVNQAAIDPEALDALAGQLTDIQNANGDANERLNTLAITLGGSDPAGDAQQAIKPMIISLQNFTAVFVASLSSASLIVIGLMKRAEGEQYTPLDYVRDTNQVKEAIEGRHEVEKSLTANRSIFLAHAKQVAIPAAAEPAAEAAPEEPAPEPETPVEPNIPQAS